MLLYASGVHLPPVIIFPRTRIRPELTDAAPPRSLILRQEHGWMNSELFLNYLEHFIHLIQHGFTAYIAVKVSFSRPGEEWIKCDTCYNWAHVLCSGYEHGLFVCDFCIL